MNIPKKHEDVVVLLNETLSREASLREDLLNMTSLASDRGNKVDRLRQRLTDAEKRNSALEAALKFYADGDHLLLADSDAWDTCSGEPINFLHDEAGTASVEDGSIAKAALKPVESIPKSQAHICDGCGAQGWTANCDKCIPY